MTPTRKRTRSTRFQATSILCAAAFALAALAGCAGGETEAESKTEEPAAKGAATSKPAPSETAEGAATDCLVGNWYVAEDQLQGFYDTVGGGSGATFAVVGGTGLSFAEDTYQYTPDFSLNLSIAGQTATGEITGSVSGNYTSDGAVITTSHESSDVAMTITMGGTVVDGADKFASFLSKAPISQAPYECTGGAPVIMFGAGDAPRVPVVLTPAG